jgi:hypothetical protein
MSCPTGDLLTGATKPTTMFLALGEGVDPDPGVEVGEADGEGDSEGLESCQAPIPAAKITITTTIRANIFFCITVSFLSFFLAYIKGMVYKTT